MIGPVTGPAPAIDVYKRQVNDHSKANGFDKEDVIGLGVGVPGAVLEFSKVNECVNLGWGSVDVAGELSKLTGCKVKATNDANACLLYTSRCV